MWLKYVELLPGWEEKHKNALLHKTEKSIIMNIIWGVKLYFASRKYDVIVTGFDRLAMTFAILQRYLRTNRKPHILLHAYWNFNEEGIKKKLKILYYKFILNSVTTLIVYGSYQKLVQKFFFGLKEDKFCVIPYHTTLDDYNVNTIDGDYVFAGGDGGRDYRTLIEAMQNLKYKLKIAALSMEHFKNIDIPENVTIKSISKSEFMEWMAGAAIVAVPLQKNLLQSGGQQTFLNAMLLGKPVIVADDNSAFEYINDGVDGYVVEPGDANKIKEKIYVLMEDKKLRNTLGENGKITAEKYPPERYIREVLFLACKLGRNNKNTKTKMLPSNQPTRQSLS